MAEFYKVTRKNYSTPEEQNKSMELIVIIIKDKNKLCSILLFNYMFYSKAVLLTEVMKFLLNCNKFFYFYFLGSRDQAPLLTRSGVTGLEVSYATDERTLFQEVVNIVKR